MMFWWFRICSERSRWESIAPRTIGDHGEVLVPQALSCADGVHRLRTAPRSMTMSCPYVRPFAYERVGTTSSGRVLSASAWVMLAPCVVGPRIDTRRPPSWPVKDGRGHGSGVVATSTRSVLVHTTIADHLAASTPSLTDIPPLQVTPRYRRDDGFTMNRSSQ